MVDTEAGSVALACDFWKGYAVRPGGHGMKDRKTDGEGRAPALSACAIVCMCALAVDEICLCSG